MLRSWLIIRHFTVVNYNATYFGDTCLGLPGSIQTAMPFFIATVEACPSSKIIMVALAGYGSPYLDSRVPDLIIGAKPTTLWSDGFEFEDHGSFLPQDLDVPLFAYNPLLVGKTVKQEVSNRQVVSTLLRALGLPLAQLDGYRLGSAPVLPGLFDEGESHWSPPWA